MAFRLNVAGEEKFDWRRQNVSLLGELLRSSIDDIENSTKVRSALRAHEIWLRNRTAKGSVMLEIFQPFHESDKALTVATRQEAASKHFLYRWHISLHLVSYFINCLMSGLGTAGQYSYV